MTIFKRLWRIVFSWSFKVPPKEELETADLILTQAYSRNADGSSGPGNEILASVVRDCYILFGTPVLPQEEVSWCLTESVPQVGVANGSKDGRSTIGHNTYTVAVMQAEYCRGKGVKTVIVVAHPIHMNRALWVYERLGLRALPASMPLDYGKYQGPNLMHGSARCHWFVFWLREMFVARPLFLLQGKI